MTRRLLVVLPCLSLAAAATQAQTSEGPVVGMPAQILVAPGTSSSGGAVDPDQLHRRTAGFGGYSSAPAVDTFEDPVFTMSQIFNAGMGPPDFDVDALSIGWETLYVTTPANGVSVVDIPADAWSVLVYSVSRATAGEPGSLIAQEQAAAGGAGADLFSLVLQGSDIPPDVAGCYPTDAPQRALDAAEMDLDGGAGNGEIDSIDYHMTLYHTGPPVRGTLPDDPIVFFSVTKASVFPPGGGPSLVPASWFDCDLPSGATILRTQWIPDSGDPNGGDWTTPRVHLSYTQLGLTQQDDVDALAVDYGQCRLIFSIRDTGTSTLDEQLQVATWPCDGSDPACAAGVETGILVEEPSAADGGATTSVAQRTGISEPDGEIDTVCVIDPGTQAGLLGLDVATPLGKATMVRGMAASIYRDDDDPGGPTLAFTVTGLPTAPMPPYDVVELWVLAPPLAPLRVFWAPVAAPIFGGADHFVRKLSAPAIATLHANVELHAFWIMREMGGTLLKESSPLIGVDL